MMIGYRPQRELPIGTAEIDDIKVQQDPAGISREPEYPVSRKKDVRITQKRRGPYVTISRQSFYTVLGACNRVLWAREC